MSDNMLKKWLDRYNELEQLRNEFSKKAGKYGEDGDFDSSRAYFALANEKEAERNGMYTALNLLGYDIVYQNGSQSVVVK